MRAPVERELIFDVEQEAGGGFSAEALGEAIFTQGDSWEELRDNVQDAIRAHFFRCACRDAYLYSYSAFSAPR